MTSGVQIRIHIVKLIKIVKCFTASVGVIRFWFWKKIWNCKSIAHLPLDRHYSSGPFTPGRQKTKKSMAENKKSLFDKKLLFQLIDFFCIIKLGINRLLMVFWVDPYQKHLFYMKRKKWPTIPRFSLKSFGYCGLSEGKYSFPP